MSSAMPYLRSLRKVDLVALAEVSDLKEYVRAIAAQPGD